MWSAYEIGQELLASIALIVCFQSTVLLGRQLFGLFPGPESLIMDQVVEFVVLLVKILWISLVESIKAFLPIGVLPRKSVQGDVVLITGSGSGLGRLMCLEFGRLGCTLVLWDINEKGNDETKNMLEKEGITVCYFVQDNRPLHPRERSFEKRSHIY